MKALMKHNSCTSIVEADLPSQFDTLIKVDLAGICRTDIYAAENTIKTLPTLVLGHEFSGTVVSSLNNTIKEGSYVCVNPIFKDLTMLGLDYNGCFAEYISVPSEYVYACEGFSDNRISAYIEPIAASLAPLKSRHITKEMEGAVYGDNRIGRLTYEIMRKQGYNIQLIDNTTPVRANSLDYVVETLATTEVFDKLSHIIKPQGTLILKSRFPNHILMNFYDYVRKEILMEPLYYHNFDYAISYARENFDDFIYLLGESYLLDDWKKAFAQSKVSDKKIFFKL